MSCKPLSLFSGFGIEIEYMLVDFDKLNIRPITDQLFYHVANSYVSNIERGEIAWSNELALHVIELKTNGPKASLDLLPSLFHAEVQKINALLTKFNAKLLPSGAHPWMDPHKEAKIWPHGSNEIYAAYDRIFNCSGHGWSNLQSVHLNLPFANDHEFAQLHTAIRLLLPIIPALSASTPIIDGEPTGYKDTRLMFYAKNQHEIPSLTGDVIPEPVLSKNEYIEKVLQKIYTDIRPYDKENILQSEWLNSRGAIARFDRNTIEIRIIDTQECPLADIAVLALIDATIKALIQEIWSQLDSQIILSNQILKQIFFAVAIYGNEAVIDCQEYLNCFGWYKSKSCKVKDLWQFIFEQVIQKNLFTNSEFIRVIEQLIRQGNLAERILYALRNDYGKANLFKIYNKLADCLQNNAIFAPL